MLRAARKRQGYTQVELAEIAGVGVTYVINLEHGKETSELGKALHLAELLSVNLFAEDRTLETDDASGWEASHD